MRKYILFILLLTGGLFLSQCHNREKQRLVGVWKLNDLDINGTRMTGASLGSWMWEFNAQGGYLVDVSGQREKGVYKLNKDQLTVQITTAPNRPEATYTIARLDSVQMVLSSITDKNKSTLSFVRMRAAGVVDND